MNLISHPLLVTALMLAVSNLFMTFAWYGHLKGTSKNSKFTQMQGAEKISRRRIYMICKQEIFSATQQLGGNVNF